MALDVDQHVLGLEVAIEYPSAMQVSESTHDLTEGGVRAARGEASAPTLLETREHVAAARVAHCEVNCLAVFKGVRKGDDERVV